MALLLHQDLSIDKPGVVLFPPPSEEADPKALRVPRAPSKPGEQYWSECTSSISLSARLIWGSESFIAVDMGTGLMMDLNRNTPHVQLFYKRLEVLPTSLGNSVKWKASSGSAGAFVMCLCSAECRSNEGGIKNIQREIIAVIPSNRRHFFLFRLHNDPSVLG